MVPVGRLGPNAIQAELEDSMGPSRAHDEPVLSRQDDTSPALEAWISSLEQVLQVGAIASSGHPRDRLRAHLKSSRQQRRRRPAKSSRASSADGAGDAPSDLESKMESVARMRALKVTRQQAARVGRAEPEEADPEEIKYQLRRMWTEVRSHVERAGPSVSARRAVWARVSREAHRAARTQRRSATPQRQPFPRRSPETPRRPDRRLWHGARGGQRGRGRR